MAAVQQANTTSAGVNPQSRQDPGGCTAGFRFAIVPIDVLELGLSSGAVHLYVILAAHADRKGVSWPSRRRLAKMLRRSVDTVDRLFSELKDLGAIRVKHRFGKAGRQTTNLVELVDPHEYTNQGAASERPLFQDPEAEGAAPVRREGAAPASTQEPYSEGTNTPPSVPPDGGTPGRGPTPNGAARAKTPQAELVEWWCWAWKETRETPYQPTRKDYVIAAKLLKLAPIERVRERAADLLESEDNFYRRAADLGLLYSQWNKIGLLAPERNGHDG